MEEKKIITIKKAILKNFDAVNYKAVIQISGSSTAYLEGVTTARNLSAAEMIPGRKLIVIFWDENNPSEAVVMGVY